MGRHDFQVIPRRGPFSGELKDETEWLCHRPRERAVPRPRSGHKLASQTLGGRASADIGGHRTCGSGSAKGTKAEGGGEVGAQLRDAPGRGGRLCSVLCRVTIYHVFAVYWAWVSDKQSPAPTQE